VCSSAKNKFAVTCIGITSSRDSSQLPSPNRFPLFASAPGARTRISYSHLMIFSGGAFFSPPGADNPITQDALLLKNDASQKRDFNYNLRGRLVLAFALSQKNGCSDKSRRLVLDVIRERGRTERIGFNECEIMGRRKFTPRP
jgi:hypothetical protein